MKNNKGFTLVELIAVIVILGLIMLIASRNFIGIWGEQNIKLDETKIENIKKTAIIYGQEKSEIFNTTSYKCTDQNYQDLSTKIGETINATTTPYCVAINVKKLYDDNYLKIDEFDASGNPILIEAKTNTNLLDSKVKVIIYRRNNRVYSELIQ